MSEWLTVALAALSGALGGGIAWGVLTVRVSRLEQDVNSKASTERTNALEQRIETTSTSLEKRLDKIDDDTKAIRSIVERVAYKLLEDTDPRGRRYQP